MTSNAFCSVYLLLLFCCKIQNVITYKFHYFLKELNYLISVWSKKMCLLMAEIANKINHNPVWGPNLKYYWIRHWRSNKKNYLSNSNTSKSYLSMQLSSKFSSKSYLSNAVSSNFFILGSSYLGIHIRKN